MSRVHAQKCVKHDAKDHLEQLLEVRRLLEFAEMYVWRSACMTICTKNEIKFAICVVHCAFWQSLNKVIKYHIFNVKLHSKKYVNTLRGYILKMCSAVVSFHLFVRAAARQKSLLKFYSVLYITRCVKKEPRATLVNSVAN